MTAVSRDPLGGRQACKGMNFEDFYPTSGDTTGVGRALAVCRTCPVRQDCLDLALARPRDDDWGIVGGTTQRQRQAMRRSTPALSEAKRQQLADMRARRSA